MTAPKMDLREFHDRGYLEEANRRFFHPLGLALAITTPRDNPSRWERITLRLRRLTRRPEVTLGPIFDSRDDPEGYCFGYPTEERRAQARERAAFVDSELEHFRPKREELFSGSVIQSPGVDPS